MFNRSKSLLATSVSFLFNHTSLRDMQAVSLPTRPSSTPRPNKRNRFKTQNYSYYDRLKWWTDQRKKQGPAFNLIQSMTNWQNHQWRKAGGKRDLGSVKTFSQLIHPNHSLKEV
ncbi:MAG: hypothetical protein HRU28_05530 [Rhizobiales bacterium]|nr:hypothetical protein [Hyphomicrobiales bacterium]